MIIRSLHINHFGKWHGLRLQNLEGGINLFYGPNETGKTTLMQFLRTIFYGFSRERLSYVFAPEPEKTGGDIQIVTPQGEFTVARSLVAHTGDFELPNLEGTEGGTSQKSLESEEIPLFARASFQRRYQTQTIEEGLKITDATGARQDTFQWKNLVNIATMSANGDLTVDTDETLFNNIFAIGLQELQRLSVLNSTEASRQLYDLSTGVLRYSMIQILSKIVKNRERLLSKTAIPETLKTEDLRWCESVASPILMQEIMGKGREPKLELTTLFNYRQILVNHQKNIQTQNKQYGKIHAERTLLSEKIHTLTEEIQQQNHKIKILEIAIKIQSEWDKREKIDQEIIDFGDTNPDLANFPEQDIDNLRNNLKKIHVICEDIAKLNESREKYGEKIISLQKKQEKLSYNSTLLQAQPTLESLLQHREWIENLRGRLEDLQRLQLDSEAQLSIDYRRLNLEMPAQERWESPAEEIFPYSVRALRPLKTPSREMRQIRKQIQATQKKRAELLHDAEDNALKLAAYFRACKERCAQNVKIQSLPGMANFPDCYLVNETEIIKREVNTLKITENIGNFAKSQNLLDSQIVSEIPEKILNSGKNPPKRSQASADVNLYGIPKVLDVDAASRLLGEVLSAERRSEVYLQQLIQTLDNTEKLQKDEKIAAQSRVLSNTETLILGGFFTLGLTLTFFTMLYFLGILTPCRVTHVLFFLVGVVMLVGSTAWRIVKQQKVYSKWTEICEMLPTMQQQRNRLVRLFFAEREDDVIAMPNAELVALCRKEAGKLQERAGFLESELKEAESASEFLSKRLALLSEVQHLMVRNHKLRQKYREAKKRREELLKKLRLPEKWTSANIRQLIDATDRIRELWRRRARDVEDFRLYSQELSLLVKRVEKSLSLFGDDFLRLVSGGDARFPYVANIFTLMESKIAEENNLKNISDGLLKEIKETNKELRQLKSELKQKKQRCRLVLKRAGVTSVKQLREKLKKLEILSKLREERKRCQKNIDGVVGFTCTESMLWEVYENNRPEQILERSKILLNSLTENEFQLEAAQKRDAECRLILEKIVMDDSPARLQYELKNIDAKINKVANSWRVYAMTERLLETVQKTYQQKRQPKTLECASGFLCEMTHGKYIKVWTPVDEDLLFVQREDGENFLPGQLSTGTRELLYLAIRLALIDEYRLRNVHLPIVLDDVLVNFDRSRAAATARVLTQFAGTDTQVFFFTSHEHIRDIFIQENALICDMTKSR